MAAYEALEMRLREGGQGGRRDFGKDIWGTIEDDVPRESDKSNASANSEAIEGATSGVQDPLDDKDRVDEPPVEGQEVKPEDKGPRHKCAGYLQKCRIKGGKQAPIMPRQGKLQRPDRVL